MCGRSENFAHRSFTEVHTITFKADDGTQMIYTLNGNKLINEATSDEVILTEERLAELKKALGMSIS